ncbi:hypothetical protein GCM10025857_09590 [Alicyclobacillus contaminans]|uniref:OsmC family protein n=1 Tax=Alicyclobacillus contaminans TaxID=392016 RepID=UPI0004096BFE|nr:OsmC family protein [Alicyclobacillus contaminans]GMA49602.1 hypothetical protein GCM10025857_09590 [Alicyclobacillus contaminans]
MTQLHTYTVRGEWSGDRHGTGHVSGERLSSALSVPTNLGGPGVGTNPEELLLSAANGCYLITLAILLTNRKVPYTRLELESEGFVVNDRGLRYDRIEHRPTIHVAPGTDVEQVEVYAEQAEHACMISSAIRGNVRVTVVPRVVVETSSNA